MFFLCHCFADEKQGCCKDWGLDIPMANYASFGYPRG